MSDAVAVRSIGRLATIGPEGTIERAALVMSGGTIAYAGPEAGLREAASALGFRDVEEVDAGGALVTPGLIDAHTHPVYGGNRFAEIALRSTGASYSEIAAAGGGIASSVTATRDAGIADLEQATKLRLEEWLAGGTTTVEAKTGYFLDEAGELEAVRLLSRLNRAGSEQGGAGGLPSIEVTWLAGHAVGPEFAGDADAYIEAARTWAPAARRDGARHADVFCDAGYFTVDQSRRLLASALQAGLLSRIHADELAHTGGSRLAAEIGCASADHLLLIDDEDASALAASGVVATLAPITALAMGRTPPVQTLLGAGATIALGSDHNPGTCGTTSMTLVLALAVAELGLSVSQALEAGTAGGAASLRLTDRGRLLPGLRADAVLWDADHEGTFAWSYGVKAIKVWTGGRLAQPTSQTVDRNDDPL